MKEIDIENHKLSWFYYSTIGGSTQDYVLLSQGEDVDTLAASHYVKNVRVLNDTIVIEFFSREKKGNFRRCPDLPNGIYYRIDTGFAFNILESGKYRLSLMKARDSLLGNKYYDNE